MTEEATEIILDDGQEEEVFAFGEEKMRNEHAMLKRKQASALGRETGAVKGLTKMIKTNKEKRAF